jgi:hypothetical protein
MLSTAMTGHAPVVRGRDGSYVELGKGNLIRNPMMFKRFKDQ